MYSHLFTLYSHLLTQKLNERMLRLNLDINQSACSWCASWGILSSPSYWSPSAAWGSSGHQRVSSESPRLPPTSWRGFQFPSSASSALLPKQSWARWKLEVGTLPHCPQVSAQLRPGGQLLLVNLAKQVIEKVQVAVHFKMRKRIMNWISQNYLILLCLCQ